MLKLPHRGGVFFEGPPAASPFCPSFLMEGDASADSEGLRKARWQAIRKAKASRVRRALEEEASELGAAND